MSHRPDARQVRGSFVGIAGMAVVLFLVLASSPLAPLWALALLTLVWLALLVTGARWFMTHPRRVAAIPVVMLVIWVGTIAAGTALLDWNA